MARIKYYFDTDSSQFVRQHDSLLKKVLRVTGIGLLSFALAMLMGFTYYSYFESLVERKLKGEILDMESNYGKLDTQLTQLQGVIATIEKRDDHVYRMVLGTEPMDASVRNGGVGGVERYSDIRNKRMAHADLIVELHTKMDKLRRKLYIELVSQDELVTLVKGKEELYASIPAIQPVSNKELTALSSGFGLRLDPIYRVIVMHTGIDFAAPEGSPVYATADGVVVTADTVVYGYGNMITIDHGHGYRTRYAHLRDFNIQPGKHVKRGAIIAHVGNTGLSTAPHLHYEVMLAGTQVNPVHYFFKDLNPQEYSKITELASLPHQTMGN